MEIRTIDDYYEQVYEKFPFIPHSDIQRILKYGFRYIYYINSIGGDILYKSVHTWFYMGGIAANAKFHFHRYANKLAKKIRTIFKWKKKPYSGYYYFALTEYQQQQVEKQKKSKGRKRIWFNYGRVFLYKYLEECSIREHAAKYIYRVSYPLDIGYLKYKTEFISKDAELIEVREPLTFEDISVNKNKYEYINASSKHFH